MSLTNRPIIPKTPKARNPQMRKWYKSQHSFCEVCALEGDQSTDTDIHHILKGADRVDLIWNIVSVCRYHHLEIHERYEYSKVFLFALKYLKGEVSQAKLESLDLLEETEIMAEKIRPIFNKYKRGLL